MVTTNDADLHARAVACHDQGTVRGNDAVVLPAFVGENYRMTELSAAVMLEQMKKLGPAEGARAEGGRAYQAGGGGISGCVRALSGG